MVTWSCIDSVFFRSFAGIGIEGTGATSGHRKRDLPSDGSATSPNGRANGTREHYKGVEKVRGGQDNLREEGGREGRVGARDTETALA